MALPLPRTRDQGGAVQLDRRALAVGAAGGQLDIDSQGRLKRWCCYTYASYVDAEAVAKVATARTVAFRAVMARRRAILRRRVAVVDARWNGALP